MDVSASNKSAENSFTCANIRLIRKINYSFPTRSEHASCRPYSGLLRLTQVTNHTNHAHSINLDDYFFVWPKLSSNRKLNGYKIKYPRHRHAPVAFSDRFSQVQSCTGRAYFSGMGSYFFRSSLSETSELVGYNHWGQFSREYKRCFGVNLFVCINTVL